MKPNWRHQYDEARDKVERKATDITISEPSLTIQAYAEDADLNVIMRRYGVTDGAIPPMASDPKYFGDFTDVVEFREAMDRVHQAKEAFKDLPAKIRDRFQNDPLKLWEFVNDPDNDDEAIKLGLLQRVDPSAGSGSPASGSGSPPSTPNPTSQTGSGTGGPAPANTGTQGGSPASA